MRAILCASVFLLCVAVPARAQDTPPTSPEAALASLADRASVVFAGEVIAVELTPAAVTIRFRVDSAIKGVATSTYELREWPGLWAAGQRRFFAGERAIFFLHAPATPGGFGGPVDGLDGIVPIKPSEGVAAADLARTSANILRPSGSMLPQSTAAPLTQVVALLTPPASTDPIAPPLRPTPPVIGARPIHPIAPPTHKLPRINLPESPLEGAPDALR